MKKVLTDIKDQYRILVPLDMEAEDRMYRYEIYNDDANIDECFDYLIFNYETEEYIERRLFRLINAKFNIIINIYEEEILENKDIPEAIELVKRVINNNDDDRLVEFATDLIDLFEIAQEKGTSVGFYF